MPAPKKSRDAQKATFSPTATGVAVGVVAFAVVFILLPGIGGAVLGAAAGTLGFFGMKTLMSPDPTIGDVAVDAIQNGEKIKERIDAAKVFQQTLVQYEASVRDAAVKREIRELHSDLGKLVSYVEANPQKWNSLTHWMNTFADTAASMLSNYSQQEKLATGDAKQVARAQVVKSLDVLEGAAQGELANAMNGDAISLAADAEALEQLAKQDGYSTDSRQSSRTATAAPAPLAATSPDPFSTNDGNQWSGLKPLA